MLMGVAADNGLFAASGVRSAADLIPGVRDLNLYALGDALTFGAILGFLAAIFGGWLGGLLAPSHVVAAVTPVRPVPMRAGSRGTDDGAARGGYGASATHPPGASAGRAARRVETDEVHTTRVEETVRDRS